MSELIAAKAKGELLERFQKEQEKLGDETTSELVRDLLDRGLTDRTTPLFARLGLPNRVAARLEADREDGEPDEEVIRRFLREAVDARDEDALDAIGVGADDDLRTTVEEAREDGEPLDDAVRRLVRTGVNSENRAAEGGRGPFSRLIPQFALLSFTLTLFTTWLVEPPLQALLFGATVTAVPTTAGLLGQHRRLDAAFAAGREAVGETGRRVVGFVSGAKAKIVEDHPAPSSPTTLVERLAWFDVYSYYVAVALVGFGLVLRGLYELMGAGTVAEALGPWGSLAVLVLIVLGAYVYVGMQFVGFIAQIAVASAASEATATSTGSSVE